MARKQDKNQESAGSDEALGGNVDQIRQILFGGQMRDYEKRFMAMEKHLTKSVEQLANSVEKRIDRLDKYAKREVEKLSEQIKAERKVRTEEGKQSSKNLDELAQQVESWFAETEEQMETEARDLRSAVKTQGDDLLLAIDTMSKEQSSNLAAEAAELADAKLGREDLASLLSEVALRLKKDFKLPKT